MKTSLPLFCNFLVLLSSPVLGQVPQGFFTDIRPVPGLNVATDIQDLSVGISSDGLAAYFGSPRPASSTPGDDGPIDIFVSKRSSIDAPFESASKLGSNINLDGANNNSPHLSEDGLRLYFHARQESAPALPANRTDLWMSQRTSVEIEDWGPRVPLTILNTDATDANPSLTADELTIVFDRIPADGVGSTNLFMATRETRNEPFGEAVPLSSVNSIFDESAPSISSDGLTLFYTRLRENAGFETDVEIWTATRASRFDEFSSPQQLEQRFDVVGPVSINIDQGVEFTPFIDANWPAPGSKLYWSLATSVSDWDFYEATWIPEPSTVCLAICPAIILLTRRGRLETLTSPRRNT